MSRAYIYKSICIQHKFCCIENLCALNAHVITYFVQSGSDRVDEIGGLVRLNENLDDDSNEDSL